MKHITLEEALRLATPGPLKVTKLPLANLTDYKLDGADTRIADMQLGLGATAINAALLAHCWNNFLQLVEALDLVEKALTWGALVKDQERALGLVRSALAAAKKVEVAK